MIPTLNEIEGMKVFMPSLKPEWYDELIVVDGGSNDGTIEYCKENGYPIVVQSGKGLPLGYVEGIDYCTKDIVITITPDGNSCSYLIPVLTAKIEEGYDMVIASRYLGDAKSYDDDLFTGFGNKMFTKTINWVFGSSYTDCLVGLRAYKREALLAMHMDKHEQENWIRNNFFYMNSWETGSSIRATKLQLKVTEIPGDEPERIGGVRKLSISRNGLGVVLQILFEWQNRLKFTSYHSNITNVLDKQIKTIQGGIVGGSDQNKT